jgi:2-polyprenyl-3-methyl-5-hydroxy-6-metoxy-1,4-benzoquinol methylase
MEPKERIMNLCEEGWKRFYDSKFMKLESYLGKDFSEKVSKPDYRFVWVMNKMNKGKVLDIGFGDGILLKCLFDRGFDCYGVDLSPKTVGCIQKLIPEAKLTQGNIEKLPYENETFDYVVGTEILEHVPNLQKAIEECFRVCKKGGKLLFTVPVGRNCEVSEHLRFFEFYDICDLFEKYNNIEFKICRIPKFVKGDSGVLFAIEVVKNG